MVHESSGHPKTHEKAALLFYAQPVTHNFSEQRALRTQKAGCGEEELRPLREESIGGELLKGWSAELPRLEDIPVGSSTPDSPGKVFCLVAYKILRATVCGGLCPGLSEAPGPGRW